MLVVIVIIAILAALTTPALIRGMASARQSKCASNLRQIFGATTAFAQDNDGLIVMGLGGNIYPAYPVWSDALTAYLGMDKNNYGPSGKRPTGVFACPSSQNVCNGGARSDYSSNGRINVTTSATIIWRLNSLPSPALTIAFIDGGKAGNQCNRSTGSSVNSNWGVVARHGKTGDQARANALYFDGHVEALRIQDIPLNPSSSQYHQPWDPNP